MNRWVWPGTVVGVLAVTTTVASMVGAQPIPIEAVAPPAARVSVVCPAFQSVTARLRMAAVAAAPGLRTSKLSAPGQASSADELVVLTDADEPVRVSASLQEPFGASAVVRASAGPDRGLSASACRTARTEHWFTGVDVGADAQSEVVVVNLDGTRTSVDLTAFGEEGRLSAPRGVEVDGNATETISLGVLPRADGPLGVAVSSPDGRVAAFVRQRTWDGDAPLGADWLPAAAAPATDLVVPGIPAGTGARRLVVTNPGDRTASVDIELLSEAGSIGLSGLEQLEVPAGTTRSVELASGLDGQSGALRLSATQPVTAAAMLDSGATPARHDPAFVAAIGALPADGIWPLAAGRAARTVLQLTNPGETEAAVSVTAAVGTGAGEVTEVTVPAGSTAELALAAGSANVVRIQTEATGLRGALISTERLGSVRGLAVLGLLAEDPQAAPAEVVFDPHVGS